MQYLLTEEEYNNLHGDKDEELEELKLKLNKLNAEFIQFFQHANVEVWADPSRMNAEKIGLSIEATKLPDTFKNMVESKLKT